MKTILLQGDSITDAGRDALSARRHDLDGIQAGLADSIRLIADEVRGSVRAAMKSLQADLAAAANLDHETATRPSPTENPRAEARAQAQRADAAWCVVNARNTASLALQRSLGFTLGARAAGFGTVHFTGGAGVLLCRTLQDFAPGDGAHNDKQK